MTDVRELAAWHAQLDRARTGRELLDLLLSPADAKRRIRAMPAQDLYHFVVRIGLADATELLALASPEQVRTFFDFDAWKKDRLSIKRVDPWLEALTNAGPEALMRGLLALDDEVLNWIVRRSVRIYAIDEPEEFEPPDGEYVLTPDGRMCIVFPEPSPRDLPVKVFLDWLMRSDPAHCYNLFVHASSALDSVLEEQAWRWRSGRMADLGYVDPYEAPVVYTPPRPDQIRAARASLPGDVAPASHWLAPLVAPADRLQAAVDHLPPEPRRAVQEALAYLANMALAADRVEPWDLEGQRPVLDRVRAGLLLGLDALAGADADPARDAALLVDTSLVLVFRTGHARVLEAARPLTKAVQAKRLAGPGGRVDGVDLAALRPWAESLSARHPQRPDGTPFATPADLETARQRATLIAELADVAGDARPPEAGLAAWLFTQLTLDLLGLEGRSTLPLVRVAEAHRAIFRDGQLRADARAAAGVAWRRLGGRTDAALDAILAEAIEQMGHVAPETAADEPRFLPMWRVGPPAA